MSEQEKKEKEQFLVVVIEDTSIKKAGKTLQDAKNRLFKEGYRIEHIEKDRVMKKHIYVIHAFLPSPQLAVMIGLPIPQPPQEQPHGSDSPLSERAKLFLRTLFDKALPGTPAAVLEQGPGLIPTIVQGMPSLEISELAEEMEHVRVVHMQQHPDPECDMMKVYTMLGEKLREQAKHSLQ